MCVNVTITVDDIYENDETFTVTVSTDDTQVVVEPDRETGTVTIIDEDGTSIIMDSLSAYCILNKNSLLRGRSVNIKQIVCVHKK